MLAPSKLPVNSNSSLGADALVKRTKNQEKQWAITECDDGLRGCCLACGASPGARQYDVSLSSIDFSVTLDVIASITLTPSLSFLLLRLASKAMITLLHPIGP